MSVEFKTYERDLSADCPNLHRLLNAAESGLPVVSPKGKAAILLWSVADIFAASTSKSEFVFLDVALRVIGQTFADLDREIAHEYLKALSNHSAAECPEEKQKADRRMRAHFIILRNVIELADTPAQRPG